MLVVNEGSIKFLYQLFTAPIFFIVDDFALSWIMHFFRSFELGGQAEIEASFFFLVSSRVIVNGYSCSFSPSLPWKDIMRLYNGCFLVSYFPIVFFIVNHGRSYLLILFNQWFFNFRYKVKVTPGTGRKGKGLSWVSWFNSEIFKNSYIRRPFLPGGYLIVFTVLNCVCT